MSTALSYDQHEHRQRRRDVLRTLTKMLCDPSDDFLVADLRRVLEDALEIEGDTQTVTLRLKDQNLELWSSYSCGMHRLLSWDMEEVRLQPKMIEHLISEVAAVAFKPLVLM